MIIILTSHNNGEDAIHYEYLIEGQDEIVISAPGIGDLGDLIDNGNGYEITIDELTFSIDYHMAEIMLALLLSKYDGKMKLFKSEQITSI